MAITNHDRVGKALELLTGGLKPFVERELKSAWGDKFLENTKTLLGDTRLQARAADGSPLLDVAALLVIMDREWKGIFSQTLGKAERSMVNEVLDVRNKWAHQRSRKAPPGRFSPSPTHRVGSGTTIGRAL